jgi:ketosteroid isomerase-like protein
MPEHPNVQRVRDAYAAFAAGDLAGALEDLAPDGVFHFTGQGPLSGDHKGFDDISAALIGTFELTGGTQKLEIRNVYANDDHAIVTVRETATRTDGKTLDVEEAHLITFDGDGRITNLWDLPVDPQAHDDFFDGV